MKISFTTAFMNREHHLQKTIKHNLAVMANYDYEYLILDYSSKSDKYIKELSFDERLMCYRADGYNFYHHSHAKNIITKKISGDFIIHLDADNLLSIDFLDNVIYLIKDDINKYVINSDRLPDLYGRICISKNNFKILSGYDEHMIGWGHEDTDLIQRASALLGLKYIVIDEYLTPINHNNKERVKHTKINDARSIYRIAFANASIMKDNYNNKVIAPNKIWGVCESLKLLKNGNEN